MIDAQQPFVGFTLVVPDNPKMIRETLCVAQARIAQSDHDRGRVGEHMARLQRLIDECDRLRPLGPDGKHGDRHTNSCGCQDCTDQNKDRTGGTDMIDIEREAWRMLLDGAESHVEDDMNEDGEFTDGDHEMIVDRAMTLIHRLRASHVASHSGLDASRTGGG